MLPKELSTGYSCPTKHWDVKTERIKSIAAEDAKTNDALTHLENKVKNNYRYLREMEPDLVITSCELKDRVKGKITKGQTLLGVFREHNA